MSLKPEKKSDINKAWNRSRRDRARLISPEYHLIVTEGTKTEPQYFKSISGRYCLLLDTHIKLCYTIIKNRTKAGEHNVRHGRTNQTIYLTSVHLCGRFKLSAV